MGLWDRVRDEAMQLAPTNALPGRYIADDAQDVAFGSIRANPGDRLIADPDNSWSAVLPAGCTTGHFASADIIEEAEQLALDALDNDLCDSDGRLSWEKLTTVVPFKQPPPDQLKPTPLDHAISTHGPHLLEVVREPHKHLDAIIEPVRPGLARRIPPRAIEYLAEHSEDWQQRTVRAVIPRRVLSQHADEQLDIYENRLVARTIDRLLGHLNLRSGTLETYQQQLDASDQDDLDGPRWLARRLATLWGTIFDVDEQRERLASMQTQLNERLRQIGKLKDSQLYRAVPRRARIDSHLRMTNVLANHQHYQRVVELWRALDDIPTPSEHDAYNNTQRTLRAFDAFTLLLLARSLNGLGYTPNGNPSLTLNDTGEMALNGPRGPLVLGWDPLRGATLRREDVMLARFVPLATRLGGTLAERIPRDPTWIRARIEELLAEIQATQPTQHTILLYPSRRQERESLPADLAQLLNPPDAGLAPAPSPAVLPVSPLDLYSAERVDRVVRRVVLIDLFERFPAPVACSKAVRKEASTLVPWLKPHPSGEGLALLEPPDAPARTQLRALVHERTRALRQRRDDALRETLSSLPNTVEQAADSFKTLEVCPVCGATGGFLPWAQGHFKYACKACKTSWGLRPCTACEARIPFLALDPKQRPQLKKVTQSERLDREYGRDLLAIPNPNDEDTFQCPTCGT